MELDALRAYHMQKKRVTEELPFGPETLVFKVAGKMFALIAWQYSPLRISLKCDPDDALALRDMYPAVQPGYYLNKTHWNTITLDGTIPDAELLTMIDNSYRFVVKSLKKAEREALLAGT
ncbi:hypothetical protein U14_01512 [Candidatus Moduliflexus flocculans]|uniref:MmcQ-like protein n=1 Tax=Candidatus Moduliflexus flocculans TaxID=1499966 RepID=A0A0S6VWS5_9BACT|nr:hypothetical protein U14_01512 [Candidatus Moduliflexus flocculans]